MLLGRTNEYTFSAMSFRLAQPPLTPREAALQLRISFPTIKQWIYAAKIKVG